MSLDLGDALLAFAGGAAQEYNTNVRAENDSRRKMSERAQELAMQADYHRIQTEWATDYKQYVKDRRTQQMVSAYGADTVMGQMQGLVGSGAAGSLAEAFKLHQAGARYTAKELGEAPRMNLANMPEGYQVPEKLRAANERMAGGFRQDIAALADEKPQFDVSNIDMAKMKEIFDPTQFQVVSNAQGVFLVDPSGKQGMQTLMRTPQKPKAPSAYMEKVLLQEKLASIPEDRLSDSQKNLLAGLTQELGPKADKEAKFSYQKLSDGTIGVFQGGQMLRTAGPEEVPAGQKPRLNVSTVAGEGDRDQIVATTMNWDGEAKAFVPGKSFVIGEKERQSADRDFSKQKVQQNLKTEARNAGDVLSLVARMPQVGDIRQFGVTGALTKAAGNINDLYESITGVRPGKDGIQPTSLAFHMSKEFADGRAAQDWIERRAAQGRFGALETMLKYRLARMLKPEGKLNVDDMERTDNILGTGIKTGVAYANALSEVQSIAEQLGQARISEIIQGQPDQYPNFTGSVRYVPKARAWYYEVEDPNQPGGYDFKQFNLGG